MRVQLKGFQRGARVHSCDILAKNMAIWFYPRTCLSNVLISLLEEVSRYLTIDSHMVVSNHSYEDLPWKRAGQTIRYSLRKRAPGILMFQPRLADKGVKRGLICIGIKGRVSSRQDRIQVSFQLLQRKGLKCVSAFKNQRQKENVDSRGPGSIPSRQANLGSVVYMFLAFETWGIHSVL